MVCSEALIKTIARQLKKYGAEHIVADPVMLATSGARLINENALQALKEELLPLAQLVTPNIPEAEILSGCKIQNKEAMLHAARRISEKHCPSVLLKGGHSLWGADDLLYTEGEAVWFCAERIDNPNTHGTGCTLSSAVAASLAKGFSLKEAVRQAKEYVSGALAAQLDLGKGSGPINHLYKLPNN